MIPLAWSNIRSAGLFQVRKLRRPSSGRTGPRNPEAVFGARGTGPGMARARRGKPDPCPRVFSTCRARISRPDRRGPCPRRSRSGCARAPSTRWSARGTCSRPGIPLRRLIEGGRRRRRLARSCGARPAPARPRSPRAVAGRPAASSSSSRRSSAGVKDVRAVIDAAPARRDLSGDRDRAVPRRGPPLHQGPAGRPAARGGEPAGHCWSPPPPRTRPSRSSPRCCRARCSLTLQPLTDDDVARRCCGRAGRRPRGLGGAVTLDDDAPRPPRAARRRRRPPRADRLEAAAGRRGRAGARGP